MNPAGNQLIWKLGIVSCKGDPPTIQNRAETGWEIGSIAISQGQVQLFAKITLEVCVWLSKFPVPVSPLGIATYIYMFSNHFLLAVLFPFSFCSLLAFRSRTDHWNPCHLYSSIFSCNRYLFFFKSWCSWSWVVVATFIFCDLALRRSHLRFKALLAIEDWTRAK